MELLLRFEWRKDGVLTDATAVRLSNSGATAGAIRTDTSAVVVADNVSMTRSSTGVYDYSFTVTPGITYEWYPEVVTDEGTFRDTLTSTAPGLNYLGLTVEEARLWVREAILDQSARTDETAVDRAIQVAGEEFCRKTGCVQRADTVTLTADSSSFPTATPITYGFRPDRILDIIITGQAQPLAVVAYPALNRMVVEGIPDAEIPGPSHIAFQTPASNGTLWPTPTVNGTATLRYWQPFTSWTLGATDSGTLATVLNIPSDLIKRVLVDGAAAVLKAPDKEAQFGEIERKRFQEFIADVQGAATLAPQVIMRRSGRDVTRSSRRVIREVLEG